MDLKLSFPSVAAGCRSPEITRVQGGPRSAPSFYGSGKLPRAGLAGPRPRDLRGGPSTGAGRGLPTGALRPGSPGPTSRSPAGPRAQKRSRPAGPPVATSRRRPRPRPGSRRRDAAGPAGARGVGPAPGAAQGRPPARLPRAGAALAAGSPGPPGTGGGRGRRQAAAPAPRAYLHAAAGGRRGPSRGARITCSADRAEALPGNGRAGAAAEVRGPRPLPPPGGGGGGGNLPAFAVRVWEGDLSQQQDAELRGQKWETSLSKASR